MIKDYDLNIQYPPDKANVMADALSRRSYCKNLMEKIEQPELHEVFEKMKLEIVQRGQLNEMRVTYNLEDQI